MAPHAQTLPPHHHADEIADQPALWRRQATAWVARGAEILGVLEARPNRIALGRGSLAYAAAFAAHLHSARSGRPGIVLDPLLFDDRQLSEANWADSTVWAFSATGETGDVARCALHLRMSGAQVIGITCAPKPALLDDVCDQMFRLPIGSSRPRSMATVGAAFAGAAILHGLRGGELARDAADDLELAVSSNVARRTAQSLVAARTITWVADGALYPVACEGAARIAQLTKRPSIAYTTAELLHGALSGLGEDDVALFLCSGTEPTLPRRALRTRLGPRRTRSISIGGEHLASSERPDLFVRLTGPIWTAAPVLLGVAQLIAWETARAMGLDLRTVDGLDDAEPC